MQKEKYGKQTPTTSRVLPYRHTKGPDAVDIYELSGRRALEWQRIISYDILAQDENGRWVHSKFGYEVPRQNGKGEILIIRELYGLAVGERILHTAHRTSTEHAAWERLCRILDDIGTEYASIKAKGQEKITLESGGRIEFRTRTAKGGLGESYDLLVVDEAQEYQSDQESALKYVIAASENPQTIYCGTPPTPVSSGTVFQALRHKILGGETTASGWSEWSVEKESDPEDRTLWYMTNPSLGYKLDERTIEAELGDKTDFNIQRLGLWIETNQKSAIKHREWEKLKVEKLPKLCGRLSVGIKYNKDGETVSLAIAARTQEGKTFLEAVANRKTREGTAWIIRFLLSLGDGANKIVIDGANGQAVLEQDLQKNKIKNVVLPKVAQFVTANARFEEGVFKGTICHMDQPSLTQAVTNCEHRAIGTRGGFGYKENKAGVDISLLDAAVLAFWASGEYKERSTQHIGY